MTWELMGAIALVTAGAVVAGHGLVRLATGAASVRSAADSLLIGTGAAVVGAAAKVPGVPETVGRVIGLALVLGGTLLWLHDHGRGKRERG